VLKLGFVIARIELQQQSACLHELVIFHLRIDVTDGSTDASAQHVQMSLDLGIVCGFVVPQAEHPHRSCDQGQREDREKNPARQLCVWRAPLRLVRRIVVANRFRPRCLLQIHNFGFCSSRHVNDSAR
jgi:hypothetical protein